jgi:hypothetical protein
VSQHKKQLLATFLLVALASFTGAGGLWAAGINTNVALPVREGGFVYRTQVRFISASDDPSPMNRDIEAYVVPNVLVYGATSQTTLFGILPYILKSVERGSGGLREDDRTNGFGDLTFLLRQTVYARDAVQRTSRLGLIGGLEIPVGSEGFSSHSTDFVLGGVYTLQTGRHEFDTDLLYKVNTEARDLDLGDEFRYDLAYGLRLFPRQWPERGTPSQLFAVIEANGRSIEKARLNGIELDDTGGTLVFLSPGIQWVSQRVIYEASLQVPLIQNLNGSQVETDFVATAGVRIQF